MTKTFPFQGQVTSYQVPIPAPAGTGMGSYKLEKLEGYLYTSSVATYIQIHDVSAIANLTSGVSVPIRSMLLQSANGFLWQYIDDNLTLPALANGLLIVLSNTDNVYTTYSGGGSMDLSVSLEDWQIDTLNNTVTTAGSATIHRKSLSIWNDGKYHRLKTLVCTQALAATTTNYIQLLMGPGIANGATPIQEWPFQLGLLLDTSQNPSVPIAGSIPAQTTNDGTTITLSLNFGPNGDYVPENATSANVLNSALTVAASTTSGVLTAPAGNDITILATYV